jgi:hypothetical protein
LFERYLDTIDQRFFSLLRDDAVELLGLENQKTGEKPKEVQSTQSNDSKPSTDSAADFCAPPKSDSKSRQNQQPIPQRPMYGCQYISHKRIAWLNNDFSSLLAVFMAFTSLAFSVRAIDAKCCSAVAIKVNQIGTITEAMEVAKMVAEAGQTVVVSHRSGETADTLIADLAVAIGADAFRAGAPARGEHVQKYTRLLQIYEYLRDRDRLVR